MVNFKYKKITLLSILSLLLVTFFLVIHVTILNWYKLNQKLEADENIFFLKRKMVIVSSIEHSAYYSDLNEFIDRWLVYQINYDKDNILLDKKLSFISIYYRRLFELWIIKNFVSKEDRLRVSIAMMPFVDVNGQGKEGFKKGLIDMFGEREWKEHEIIERLKMGISPSRYYKVTKHYK